MNIHSFSQFVQEKNRSFSNFSQRTDLLASVLGVLLRDLPRAIGISERMFYGYRTAKYPVTAKVWNKLEAAERAAGVSNDQNTSGHALDVNANKQAKVKDFAATYGKEVMAENELRRALEMMETLARELAEKNRQIAEKDRQIERLLGLLESPPRPDDDSPEPPPPAGQRPGMVLRLRSAGQPRSGEPVPP